MEKSGLVPRAFPTIVIGGAMIGVLDGIAATVNAAVRGVGPDRVFKYVAGGVLGPAAGEGGAATIALGVLLHFVVAVGVATVFYLLARSNDIMLRHPVVAGALYGVAVYFVMAYVIVPMSLVRPGTSTWNGMITAIAIHILFVGLPVALIARRSATRNERLP